MPDWPDDVFRRPWQWKRVDRDEACSACFDRRVVVVARTDGRTAVAEWFTPGSTFYSANMPYVFSAAEYFVLTEEEDKDSLDVRDNIASGAYVEPPPDEDTPVAALPDGPAERPEEEEAEAVPADSDMVATAGVLKRAAETGVPFCEVCERNRQLREQRVQ